MELKGIYWFSTTLISANRWYKKCVPHLFASEGSLHPYISDVVWCRFIIDIINWKFVSSQRFMCIEDYDCRENGFFLVLSQFSVTILWARGIFLDDRLQSPCSEIWMSSPCCWVSRTENAALKDTVATTFGRLISFLSVETLGVRGARPIDLWRVESP